MHRIFGNFTTRSHYFPGLLLLLFTLSFLTSHAQTYRVPLVPKGASGWGYADLQGNLIVDPVYRFCAGYSEEGIGYVSKKGNYQKGKLFDLDGKPIPCEEQINPDITESFVITGIEGFYAGLLVIHKNHKWGAIDGNGNLVIPIIYDDLTQFECGYAIAKKSGNYYILNTKGEGKLLSPDLKIAHTAHFSEGLVPFEVKGQKWGFMDTLGNVVIEPQYMTVGYFKGGLSWVRTMQNKIGYINTVGEMVIEPQFIAAYEFDPESGLAMVKQNIDWVYVDTSGTILEFNASDKPYSFSEGLAIGRRGDYVGFINNQGEWAIEPVYEVAYGFQNGFAPVRIKGKWGLINTQGEWVLEPIYKNIGHVAVIY